MAKKKSICAIAFILLLTSLFSAEFSAAFATPWVDQDEVWYAHAESALPVPSLSGYNLGLYSQKEGQPGSSYGFTSIIAHSRPFTVAAGFLSFDLPVSNPAVAYQNDSASAAVISAGYEFQAGPVSLHAAFAPVYVPGVGAEYEGHTFNFMPEPGLGGSLSVRYNGFTAVFGAHDYSGDIRFDGVPVGSLTGKSWFSALYLPAFGLGYAHLDSAMKVRAFALVTDTLGVSEVLDARIAFDAAFFWVSQRFGRERVTASIDAFGGLVWSRSTKLENRLTVNGAEELYWVKADFDPEFLIAGSAAIRYKASQSVEISLFRLFANSLSDSAVITSDTRGSTGGISPSAGALGGFDPLSVLFSGLGISASIRH